MDIQTLVITLDKTPERSNAFKKRNSTSLGKYQFISGVDGLSEWSVIIRSRLVTQEALNSWSKGAIGSALSHLQCWKKCIESNQLTLIIEDDALVANDIQSKIINIINNLTHDFDILHLGWNFDSVLKAEIFPQINFISLFDDPYPNEEKINNIIETEEPRKVIRLVNSLGFPGYVITPSAAKRLLNLICPLRTESVRIGRGIPVFESYSLDSLINNLYNEFSVWITLPPLIIALNNSESSLTRFSTNPQSFGQ